VTGPTRERAVLQVADQLFLALHDDRTGHAHAGPAALGLTLAGGLLAELLLADLIAVSESLVWPIAGRRPGSMLAHRLLVTISQEPRPLPVATWLTFLSRAAADGVGTRLHAGGWLIRTERGGLLGRRVRVEFPNPTAVACVVVDLQQRLRHGDYRDLSDAAAIALIDAAGLTGPVLWDDARAYLGALVRHAPPALLALAGHLRTAVADAVVSHRH